MKSQFYTLKANHTFHWAYKTKLVEYLLREQSIAFYENQNTTFYIALLLVTSFNIRESWFVLEENF